MTVVELEKSKLDQLAAEFRSKGYRVLLHPGNDQLPGFLKSFEPDLIATSTTENVVVEVRSPDALQSPDFVRLAEAIEHAPGWRLQLAVVDIPAPQELPQRAEVAGVEQVRAFLDQARTLLTEERLEPAAILGWSAVEAILRRHAERLGVDARRRGSAYLLKHLYTAGTLDEQQYETFERMLELRNALVHGFAVSVDPDTVRKVIDEADELQSQFPA